MDESNRAFAACIGEVNNRYLNNEPPVVGATWLARTTEYDFGVRFLVPKEVDVARGNEQDLLSRLKQGIEEAMTRRSLAYGNAKLYVALSSLEAEGIKR
jgi:hypothetical protein